VCEKKICFVCDVKKKSPVNILGSYSHSKKCTPNPKWLSTRNGSPRRSAPGHPIAVASAAEPPDPMPCSLAEVLLPGSRTAAMCGMPCFLDRPCAPTAACVLGPCLHAGCARAAWVSGGSRANRDDAAFYCSYRNKTWVRGGGAWRRAWAASVGRVPVAVGRACRDCLRVDAWGAGCRCVFPQRGVRNAWTVGLVLRPVALSGLLPRGASEA
jgi:hypothetical protein